MPKPIALLIFLMIEIVLLPVTTVGGILFIVDFLLKIRGTSFSMTAYDPLFARWMLNALGKRQDEACKQLLYALPGASALTVGMMMGPTLLAMRLTELTIEMYDYPVYSSASLWGALGHRTRFFDDAMRDHLNQVEQVVILGAGWDTRAYSLIKQADVDVHVFEVDTVQTQTQKRKSLVMAKIDSSAVTFTTADFNKESWLSALKRVDFDPAKPTFVLWEGVTYYLDAEAVAATLQTLATQLAKGSAIAFDYAGKHIIEGDTTLIYRLAVASVRMIGEPWIFGISTKAPAKEQLTTFLAQNGLMLAKYEPIGNVDKGQQPHGGLVVAVNQ